MSSEQDADHVFSKIAIITNSALCYGTFVGIAASLLPFQQFAKHLKQHLF